MSVRNMLYLARHTRPDRANAFRELACHCHRPIAVHWDAVCECIHYVRAIYSRGLVLKPTGTWNGKDKNLKLTIFIRCDSNCATDLETVVEWCANPVSKFHTETYDIVHSRGWISCNFDHGISHGASVQGNSDHGAANWTADGCWYDQHQQWQL